MNDQLPPIDPEVSAQLARRAGGRVPDDLLAEVLTAVNSAPGTRPGTRWSRPIWRVPRLAAAGIGLTLVAILAVALALPGLRGGPAASPAGYPRDRALTTAELATLLAGPPLATNTTLLVSASIVFRNDVCPMDRYQTVGVIYGVDPQVCIMGAIPGVQRATSVTGIFAFRYLGQRSLGLLGQITPASKSKLAFHVADDWPLAGETFLVDGWLGAVETTALCVARATAGDVLLPNGEDCPYDDWLGDSSTAPGIVADHGYNPDSPEPSYDPLSLRGNARHVGAGGMRVIDSVDPNEPHHGVFVVRSVVEQCPSAPPQSNVGCSAWRVLAKVADISIPEPTATVTPLVGYPAGRALTTAELASVMAGPALPTNTALVAAVTIDAKTDVCPMNRYPTIGVIHGIDSQVCVVGAGASAYLAAASETGTFAFRYLAPGILGLLGEITPASTSQLTFKATDAWPTVGGTFLVDGWLYEIDGWAGFPQVPGSVQYVCPANTPEPAGDPLDPTGSDWCIYTWLGVSSAGPSSPFGPGDARPVEAAGMVQIDAIPAATAVYGTYVVRTVSEQCPQASSGDTRNCGRILARVADTLNLTPSVATPTPTPVPAETPRPGYPTDRALSTSEFAAVLAEPVQPANTTLVAQVTITGRTYCAADPYASIGVIAGMHSQVCVEGDQLTLPKVTATFALRCLRPGVVQNLGQIEPASPSQLVHRGADGWPWGLAETHTFLVGGYLESDSTGSRIVETPGGPAPTDGSAYQTVVVDAAAGVDSNAASQYGVFVVVTVWGSGPASSAGPQSDTIAFHVVARVADISVPGASASPTQTG